MGWIIAAISLLLIAVGGLLIRLINSQLKDLETLVTGKVIGFKETLLNFPVIEFYTQDGRLVQFTSRAFEVWHKYQSGQKVLVKYDEQYPVEARIYTALAVYSLPLILIGGGVGGMAFLLLIFKFALIFSFGFFAIEVWLYFKDFRFVFSAKRTQGTVIEANLEEVERKGALYCSHRVEFTADDGNKYIFDTGTFFLYGDYDKDSKMWVMYHPLNPYEAYPDIEHYHPKFIGFYWLAILLFVLGASV
jgi:Protein of unknown function (DUF3592)